MSSSCCTSEYPGAGLATGIGLRPASASLYLSIVLSILAAMMSTQIWWLSNKKTGGTCRYIMDVNGGGRPRL